MSISDSATRPRPSAQGLPLWWRLAVRELKAGLGGFGVFIGCIALGVMVITAIGALGDALRTGLSDQGRALLGGDMTFARVHTPLSDGERALLRRYGTLSETASLRTMARRPDGTDQALADVKAVDPAYPLAGAAVFDTRVGGQAAGLSSGQVGGQPNALAVLQAGDTVAVEPLILERLGLKVGDRLRVGEAALTVAAVLTSEPDAVSDRSSFGPRVLMSLASLNKTGLVQPGSLIRWRTALALAPGPRDDGARLDQIKAELATALPDAGFTIADRRDPSPQLSRSLDRLRQFLTLIGLTSLLVGGVGVANAVSTFIDRRRKMIAIFKSIGASRSLILRMLLAQIVAVTLIGISLGLVAGYIVPLAVAAAYGDKLPFMVAIAPKLSTILSATAYGLLVALLFALWPLGRAEQVRPAVLFRDDAASQAVRPRVGIIAAVVASGLALLGLAVGSSNAALVAVSFCAGIVVIAVVLRGAGYLVPVIARWLPRPKLPEAALAVASVAAPGSLARSVLMSLGLGLSLLVAVALVNAALVAELTGRLPEEAPAYFVLDVGKSDLAGLETLVSRTPPGGRVAVAPMLRGRLVKVKDIPVEAVKVAQDAQWVLSGERGLTFSDRVPDGSTVVAGQWWEAGYAGEPLVSFEAELARKLGLGLGDSVTVNVLGRNISAKVASLRDVKWDNLALNFVMVFSPNTLASAPYKLLATISLPKQTSLPAEAALAKAMGQEFPAMTPIRVKDAIAQFNTLLDKVLTAVRAAGGVTLAAGALVLAGAMATAQRQRILDAVILKAIGVTRRRILIAHFIEYGLLALIAAAVALAVGTLAADIVLEHVMHVAFVFSWAAVGQALGLAFLLVALFGGVGTALVLRAPAVAYLKSE